MALDQYLQSTIREIKGDPELLESIAQRLVERLGIAFISEKEPEGNVCFINSDEVRPEFRLSFSSTDLYDYLCAVLNSTTYRSQHKGLDQTDLSRIPIPNSSGTFWRLVQLGAQLRQLHLLESPVANATITLYPPEGHPVVDAIRYEGGRVYINNTTYLEGVPEPVWHLYLGDHQPARQWLLDRKGHTLTPEDIMHYQRIITTLSQSLSIISEIDKLRIE